MRYTTAAANTPGIFSCFYESTFYISGVLNTFACVLRNYIPFPLHFMGERETKKETITKLLIQVLSKRANKCTVVVI